MQAKLLICNKIDYNTTTMKIVREFFREDEIIFNEEGFSKIPLEDLKHYKTIFLQSELMWYGGGPRLNFGGFKFAEEELRLNKVRARIFFISKFKLDFFKENDKPEFQILYAPGSDLLSVEDIQVRKRLEASCDPPPISEVNLFRVIHGYCDVNDKVDTKMHTLKSEVAFRLKPGLTRQRLKQVEGFVKSEIQKLADWFIESRADKFALQNFAANLNFNGEEDINNFIGYRFSNLKKSSKKSEILNVKDYPETKPWKVLILDDRPQDLFNIVIDNQGNEVSKAYQEILNVKEVVVVSSVKKAKEIILWDEVQFNDITVVICDLELKKDNGLAQIEQGEDFIQWLELRPHCHHTFLISHLTRDMIRKTIRNFKLNCSDYYKAELKGPDRRQEFKHFISDVYEKGDDNWEVLMNRPTAERWSTSSKSKSNKAKLPLKYGYNLLRKHNDARYYEAFITSEANKAIDNYERTRELPELKFTVSEYNYRTHGIVGLCHYLIARRVIIWLYEVKKIRDKLKLAKILKPSTFDKLEGILNLRKNWQISMKGITRQSDEKEKIILVGNYSKINKILGLNIKTGKEYFLENAIQWSIQYNQIVNPLGNEADPLQTVQVIETKIENKVPICKISSIADYEEEKQENSKKQLFSNLSLNLEDLPIGILVEETSWLFNYTNWNQAVEDDVYRKLKSDILDQMNKLLESEIYQEKIKYFTTDIKA